MPESEWSAEVVVDEAWARTLIAGQFPQVDVRSLRALGEGWDTTVWFAGDRWAFRFPRRAVVIPGFERELAALPAVARQVPLPVPDPVFRGAPAEGYPWPFSGAALIPGEEAETATLTDAERARAAPQLARFLRALHAGDAGPLPADPMGRADMALRVPRTIDRLAEVRDERIWHAPAGILAWLQEARTLPPVPASALAHGDLHGRHLLVGARGEPAGVIDWVDICRADPAIDLPLYWTFLPAAGRRAFLDEYGPVDEAGLLRARVLGVFLSATLALYARRQGMRSLERGAVAALDRAAAD